MQTSNIEIFDNRKCFACKEQMTELKCLGQSLLVCRNEECFRYVDIDKIETWRKPVVVDDELRIAREERPMVKYAQMVVQAKSHRQYPKELLDY